MTSIPDMRHLRDPGGQSTLLVDSLREAVPDNADVFSRTRTHAPRNICSCDPFMNRPLVKRTEYLHFLSENLSSLHSLGYLLRILFSAAARKYATTKLR